MPNCKSAEKRLRQTEKRRLLNKDRKTELKSLRKKLLLAITDGKKDEAAELYRGYVKRLDQACANNVLHKNTASRYKSRLARRLQTIAA